MSIYKSRLFSPIILYFIFSSVAFSKGAYETTMGEIVAASVDSGRNDLKVVSLIKSLAILVAVSYTHLTLPTKA